MSPASDEPTPPPIVPEPPVVHEPPSYGMPPAFPPPFPTATPAGPLNPWTAIFTRTRAVMRQILDADPSRGVHLLALAGGILETLGSDFSYARLFTRASHHRGYS